MPSIPILFLASWNIHKDGFCTSVFIPQFHFVGDTQQSLPSRLLRRYLSAAWVSSSGHAWPWGLSVRSVLIPHITLWLGQKHCGGGRGVRVETVCWNILSKPQNMPKNNKDINHWPKGWWNSIFTSPSTSKHENAIPKGMEGASNTRSRKNVRRRAGLEKKSSNFYTFQSLGKCPPSDN